jgi:hypothetical protein
MKYTAYSFLLGAFALLPQVLWGIDKNNTLACHETINVALNSRCEASVDVNDVLTDAPFSTDFTLELRDHHGDLIADNILRREHLWTTVMAKVIQDNNGNSCWGNIEVEDKMAPVISCSVFEVECVADMNFEPTHSDNCSESELIVLDDYSEKVICDNFIQRIKYTEYAAVDEHGNISMPCVQEVRILIPDISSIVFPPSYELMNSSNLTCTNVSFENGFPSLEDTGLPSYQNIELMPGINELCDIFLEYEDILVNQSGCGRKYMRTWRVYQEFCHDFRVEDHVQVIEIEDTEDPLINCPEPTSVNTDGSLGCDAFVNLQLAEYSDDCSEVIEMDIVTPVQFFDNITEPTGLVLPVGVNDISYTIYDACGNYVTCNTTISVVDNAPPTARCDKSTVVSLRSDGTALAPAYSFDEGSFDDCNLYKTLIRRVDDPCGCRLPQYNDMEYIGEREGHHYYISTIARYGFEAFNYSEAMGGNIFVAETITEHTWLYNKIREETDAEYLIGLKDKDTTGVFRWPDHSLPSFSLWEANNPGDDIYVAVNEAGNWETVDATVDRYFFVMELDDICTFSDRIYFCCEDAGQMVPLELRVIDRFGRVNDCSLETEVQDKVPPVISCPPYMVLDCSTVIDTNNLNIYGEATATDQCLVNISSDFELDVTDCGVGSLVRIFTASDANGSDICEQVISLEMLDMPTEATIDWPDDYESDAGCLETDLQPENLPEAFGFPDFSQTDCSILTSSFDDQVFTFTGIGDDACFKIIRTWMVEDECLTGSPGYEPIMHQQVLKISNIIPPSLGDACEDLIVTTDECDEDLVTFELEVSDDCTKNSLLRGSIQLDLNSDGLGDFDMEEDIIGNSFSFSETLEVGEHFALISFVDLCGNMSSCTKSIEVNSTKGPTAVCRNVNTNLQNMDTDDDGVNDAKMVVLNPLNLDNTNHSLPEEGSYHECGFDISFSFSEDPDDQMAVFDCSHAGETVTLELWVTDEFGNTSVCNSMVQIQDLNDICDDSGRPMFDVGGHINTATGKVLENVEVKLQGGEYDFEQMAFNGSYSFSDIMADSYVQLAANKNDDALNGVSTLDLIEIQRHILGLEALDSPYKLIAADIDRSGDISARDLVELRKLILGVNDAFPENESWRMIDASHSFIDPVNPFLYDIPQAYLIEGLNSDMNVDFVAVKTGDVNDTNDFENATGIEKRHNNAAKLLVDDLLIAKNTQYIIDFKLESIKELEGVQLAIEFNSTLCDVVGVSGNALDIDHSNINMKALNEGILIMSWHELSGELAEGEKLFSVTVNAKQDVQASDLIRIERSRINSELYTPLDTRSIELDFINSNSEEGLVLYQNMPNPWSDFTIVKYFMGQEGPVKFSIYDINGALVYQQQKNADAGINFFELDKAEINASGLMYYELTTSSERIIKKMILID